MKKNMVKEILTKDHLNKKNEEIELTLDFYEGFGKDII